MANNFSNQLPQGVPFVDKRNMVDYRWIAILNKITSAVTPTGTGYVVDGSAETYATMTLFQGAYANRPPLPETGSIYFSLDTGEIFFESAGSWARLDTPLTGDVSKPAGSDVVTLNTVNFAPGTWGSSSEYPVITVNEKGLVTNVTLEPFVPATSTPGAPNYSVQFNESGVFGGQNTFIYNPTTQTLQVRNVFVGNEIAFANPVPTRTNLLPTQTGLSNYSLLTNGTDVFWGANRTVDIPFQWNVTSTFLLLTVPADVVVKNVTTYIEEAFDGTGATLTIGDAVDSASLQNNIDPYEAVGFSSTPVAKYATDTAISLFINPGTATQGYGLISIELQQR